jgi:predicted phosphodiesterase
MRILAISDISWNFVYLEELELARQIEDIHPDLVLLAGDLVNDMFGIRDGEFYSRDKYWDDVYGLFDFLNEHRIQTFCIRGNWDNSSQYDKAIKLAGKKPSFVKEISEKVEEYKGLRILGLSHAFTNSLEDIRLLSEEFQEGLDLVLAHAEYKRRIWLFHLNTKLIITGHFDKQLCQIQDKVFISLGRFPAQYVVIDYEPTKFEICYFDKGIHRTVLRKASFVNEKLIWRENRFKYYRQYANQVESLMAAKVELNLDRTKRQMIIDKLLKQGIAKRHIEEYLRVSMRSKKGAGYR